jgi:hypothetical protein
MVIERSFYGRIFYLINIFSFIIRCHCVEHTDVRTQPPIMGTGGAFLRAKAVAA